MDRASDAPVVASAGTQAEPRTPASWLLCAGRSQTAAPLPVGSDPRSVPRNEPVHIAPLPSSPALGRYAKGLPAAVILLRRNRTDRPLNEGFLLRRLQIIVPDRRKVGGRKRRLYFVRGKTLNQGAHRPRPNRASSPFRVR